MGKGWRIFAIKIRAIPHPIGPYRSAFLLSALLLLILSSCNPTRRLAEEEYLLDRNDIEVKDGELRFEKEKLKPVIKQKPNKRILGVFRFHMGIHNMANNGNDSSRVRRWLMEEVGEEPVVHDTAESRRTVEQMETYLTRKGYFQADVRDSIVKEEDKQEVHAHYLIEPGPLYRFGTISFKVGDGVVGNGLTEKIKAHSRLEEGQPFDIDELDRDRNHLAAFLRERGYYTFDKNSIHFNLDSTVSGRKVDVEMEFRPERSRSGTDRDSLITNEHRPWTVDRILVHTDHDPREEKNEKEDPDTLKMKEGYRFLYHEDMRIDPELLVQAIYIKPGSGFDAEKENLTYRRLSELRIFRSVNISYERTEEGKLDCRILLSRSPVHSFSIESRGTNRGGNLGVSGNLTYQNRNIFRGAELLGLDLSGGVESQNSLTGEEEDPSLFSGLELNTIEFGPELSLDFPKFLLPVAPTRFARSSDPRTRLSASLNFQQRPDYTRDMATVSMSYRWDETALKKHRVDPISLSMIRIDKTRDFQRLLEEFDDQFLLNSYEDHLILGSQYGFTYNSQDRSDQDWVTFFRGNFEAAGNSLQALHEWNDVEPESDGRYRIGGVGFAQFLKADADLRFYRDINDKSSVALRLFGGIGVPYGNSNVLPFQRSFYSGGANGLRAWQIRTVGPGSYTDSSFALSFDKIGDIKLEGNIEYRFDLISVVEGAFFIDAGNIWTLEENEQRPGGNFRSEEFINEIAVGSGFGLRVDLDFFIVRLDLGIPIKDPELPVGERWFFQPKERIDRARRELAEDQGREFTPYRPSPNLNLGIGYPF